MTSTFQKRRTHLSRYSLPPGPSTSFLLNAKKKNLVNSREWVKINRLSKKRKMISRMEDIMNSGDEKFVSKRKKESLFWDIFFEKFKFLIAGSMGPIVRVAYCYYYLLQLCLIFLFCFFTLSKLLCRNSIQSKCTFLVKYQTHPTK